MNHNYIIPDEWSIIEKGFDKDRVTASESLFSIGNGYMGQRANFEETYTGDTLQGSYIGGIYYPDKTRVGWWKNGYPEYFSKVLNAPNWIGINININGQNLDLNICKITDFYRELNMKEGWLKRSFKATLQNGNQVAVQSIRLLSLSYKEIGVIKYDITPLNFSENIEMTPYLDAGIMNQDTNYDEFFWKIIDVQDGENDAYILSETLKTEFQVCTRMNNIFHLNDKEIQFEKNIIQSKKSISHQYKFDVQKGDTLTLYKYVASLQSMNHLKNDLVKTSENSIENVLKIGFTKLLEQQKKDWTKIWETADIEIKGDIKAQQAIRFNIFQLNQTYTGDDSRLNIGPKGFTGEKYGGSTYWDTEAYCIPFYLGTKDKQVAKNLLLYRYNQLDKAIENAEKLGFTNGAALYPMVTMNGEESHNEWEITFEEIHRNGAMIYAIYNYVNYTGDYDYIPQNGMEVIIAVARFWAQRATLSKAKNQYVILGVTGPNEYENNVNNNWYTNYLAKWCMQYATENMERLQSEYPVDYKRIIDKTNFKETEIADWNKIAHRMYFPHDESLGIFMQQDGFMDKEIVPVAKLPKTERPINQKWSWDRILRSCYIKQADVLQGMYFFENQFSKVTLQKHFNFYEPLTVHESSLSPCVHSILASKLQMDDKAYEMYLRTARLDLDDYNHEVHEGCHITSMAGTWLSVVQGFGGMRNFDDNLSFNPTIPKEWKSYSFKINYRDTIIQVYKSHTETNFTNLSDKSVTIQVNDQEIILAPEGLVTTK
jgi:maltose phosphorylase